ncbi:hypothetical protein FSP39_002168 [Pinctada imbricata]|uniref:G-protein coupled receptors family 1 profile domain-containing protein n=1 Tax=Pinctada imbricata TaxID=66713 RepID=A0AA89BPJ7_PINIB|nr:hypothetical protein FSP39_002168 [Pinctada imbricata]
MESELTNQVLSSILLLLMVIIIFGNSLVLIAVSRFRRKATPSCILIVNLAIADLILGLVLPIQAFARLHSDFGKSKYACFLRLSSMVFSSFSSMFAVMLMAIDRFFGVCHCISYHQNNSVKKTSLAVATVWIYSILLAIYPIRFFFESDSSAARECIVKHVISSSYLIFIPVQYFVIILIISFMYFKIVKVALNKKRVISVQTGFVLASRAMRLHRELRAAKMMAAIILVFVFCWTPFAVVLLYDVSTEPTNQTVGRLVDVSVFLGIINSAVNPAIYPLQNRGFKKAFREILHCANKTNAKD